MIDRREFLKVAAAIPTALAATQTLGAIEIEPTPKAAVTKPSSTNASLSSSVFNTCGHASLFTRSMASGSSEPSSAACSAVM